MMMNLGSNMNTHEDLKRRKKKVDNSDDDLISKRSKQAGHEYLYEINSKLLPSDEEIDHANKTPDDYKEENQLQVTGFDVAGGIYICPIPMTSFTMTPFAQPILKGSVSLKCQVKILKSFIKFPTSILFSS